SPRLPRHLNSTLFPYTTLFRSERVIQALWPAWGLRRMRIRAELRKMQEQSTGRECVIPERPDETGWLIRRHGARRRRETTTTRRSEEHTSELQSRFDLVCRLLL